MIKGFSQIITIYIVCSVHWGMFRTLEELFGRLGGYHDCIGGYLVYTGGCSVHQWYIMIHVGDIMSTSGDVQYIGFSIQIKGFYQLAPPHEP